MVVTGKLLQHNRLGQPMFEKLRGEFNEIPQDAGPGEAFVGDVTQHAVHPVTKFMEKGRRIVQADQGRLTLGTLREVVVVYDDGRDGRAIGRPGA